MHDIHQIGYLPGYYGDPKYKFTKKLPQKVSVSFDCIQTDPSADFKVLVQCEPPKLYIAFEGMVKQNYQNFDLILAYDERLLTLPNAHEFIPVGSWIDDIAIDKTNQISYIMSSKIWTHEHRMRFQILRQVENSDKLGKFDFLMHRSPPRIQSKNPFFVNAKFHITCENQVMNNMFSEKLLDCFKTFTIPIYYGCKNISDYFDTRGMLEFNTIEQFCHIIDNLDHGTYDKMMPYVLKNHDLAKSYWENNIYQRLETEIEKHLTIAIEQEKR